MKTPAQHYYAAVCLFLLIGADAWAGPELGRSGPVEMPFSPVFKDNSNGSAHESRRQNGQTLRCWQEGRLLYEGSGFRGVANGGANLISLPRNGDPDITVLDLKQGLCILTGN